MANIIPDAFVIAIVMFATNISLAKMFAKKNKYVIDANQVRYLNEFCSNFVNWSL